MANSEKLRIDKYLWAIRLFKTRSLAAEACNNGKVKYNGGNIKAAKTVNINDRYEVKTEAKKWVIEVTGLLHNRQAFAEAIKYYSDLTPEEVIEKKLSPVFSFNTGKRKSKQGRPTKKIKRDLDEFME